MSRKIMFFSGDEHYFSMYNVFAKTVIYATLLKTLLCDFHFYIIEKLTTNETEASTVKLYYIHLHSQRVGIHVLAKNLALFWLAMSMDCLARWFELSELPTQKKK